MLSGWVINTATLITVTFMTEKRMLDNWEPERAQRYREYRKRTSAWIPLPRFKGYSEQGDPLMQSN